MANRSAATRRRQRWLDYPLQGAALWALAALFRMLPAEAASAVGGWLARRIGPRLGASRKAERNLALALPETTAEERRRIVAGMWENLGRIAGEYPHLRTLFGDARRPGRVEIVGADILTEAAAAGPVVLFSGHLGNWELLAPAAKHVGVPLTMVYRRPNNPLARRLIDLMRGEPGILVPKGRGGAKAVIDALARGGGIGLLVDQKMNDGLPIPFFGRDAMTAPAVAQLALRFKVRLLPARVERLAGARFRLTIGQPMPLPGTGDRNADVRATLEAINRVLEGWIRERPEQWLWLHRRWPGRGEPEAARAGQKDI